MPTIKDVECFISTASSGKLPEFFEEADPDVQLRSTGRTASCYVESEDGAEFEICVKIDNTFANNHKDATHLAVQYNIDGMRYASSNGVTAVGDLGRHNAYWLPEKPSYFQTMRFSSLEVSEDKVPSSVARDAHLGEIEVLLYRYKLHAGWNKVKGLKSKKRKSTSGESLTVPAAAKVHEKALKGRDISHTVSGGHVEKYHGAYISASHFTNIDPVEGPPYLTFRFFYRSKRIFSVFRYQGFLINLSTGALKGLGFLPSTPSPSPPPSPAPLAARIAELSTLSRDELLARAITHEVRMQKLPAVLT